MGEAIAQAAAERMGGETPDLIHLSEVFAAHRERQIAAEPAIYGKAELRGSRGNPGNAGTGEPAARASHGKVPSPFAGKVIELCEAQGENVRSVIPQPALLVRGFQSANKIVFELESMAIFEKRFACRYHIVLVGDGVTYVEPVFAGEAECCAGDELSRVFSEALVEACAEQGGPAWTPARREG
jgi:hypothetical protein